MITSKQSSSLLVATKNESEVSHGHTVSDDLPNVLFEVQDQPPATDKQVRDVKAKVDGGKILPVWPCVAPPESLTGVQPAAAEASPPADAQQHLQNM